MREKPYLVQNFADGSSAVQLRYDSPWQVSADLGPGCTARRHVEAQNRLRLAPAPEILAALGRADGSYRREG